MVRRPALVAFSALVLAVLAASPAAAERAKARTAKIATSTAAMVEVRGLRVEGSLDSARAKAALEKSLPRFRQCFQHAEKAGKSSSSVKLRVLVRPNGRVLGATVEHPSSESSAGLRKCIQNRAMDVRFPSKGSGHSTVRANLGDGRPAGIIGLLSSSPNSKMGLSNIFSKVPIGAMKGQPGLGGLGLRGSGRGGSGSGMGTIGLGGLGTKSPAVGGRGKRPTVRTGRAVVQGSLSREEIRRTIGRHVNQVRYCYERALVKSPSLEGRVGVRFVIGPSGAVTSAAVATSTLKNVPVESCIVRVVQRMRFPQPAGGGIVNVTYPFMFKAAP